MAWEMDHGDLPNSVGRGPVWSGGNRHGRRRWLTAVRALVSLESDVSLAETMPTAQLLLQATGAAPM
jgi:hypothetical protein